MTVIYALYFLSLRAVYVGQTRQVPWQRFHQHLRDATSSCCRRVHRAIRKELGANLKFVVLDIVESNSRIAERLWVARFESLGEFDILNERLTFGAWQEARQFLRDSHSGVL